MYVDKKGTLILPWPSRSNTPLSEFSTKYFFTIAFPCFFPYASGDFTINRPRTCTSLSDCAEHLLWYKDGRFAKHRYLKFIARNMIIKKQTLEKNSFIVQQKLGEPHISISELKEKIEKGDESICKKISYFSDTLRGSSQCWSRRY